MIIETIQTDMRLQSMIDYPMKNLEDWNIEHDVLATGGSVDNSGDRGDCSFTAYVILKSRHKDTQRTLEKLNALRPFHNTNPILPVTRFLHATYIEEQRAILITMESFPETHFFDGRCW